VSPFADGKDQEGTSEEINFHYGLMLWGNVSGNANLEQLGKLMLNVNSRAINYYFLMSDDNTVHPKELLPNKVTGIFFDNKVDYAIWFGPNLEYIHGIQMIPVSPIQKLYRKLILSLTLKHNRHGNLCSLPMWQVLIKSLH
jgi:endo-1,3(4)-beta-glucanase